ncbi:M48 family metalloprotease [Rhodovarius lipocyclicus]|uniref:M48 family metalloprotease n=1 Tax=Rhodovarius lipocyclicus TaxID=268410 RepID=UPI00135C17C2|nr:M48 family metalloprotease [Rhodovarius lipocyclicus]
MFGTIGLSTHVWNNNWRTILLLAGFPVLLVVLSFGLSMIFSYDAGGVLAAFRVAWKKLPGYVAFSVVVSAIWFAIAWALNQRIIDWVSGAKPATLEAEPRLWHLMDAICISRGEPMPRLGIIESEAMNAFASGLDRKKGSITVTRGLLKGLDDRELSAVLAHEMTHIRNGDARLAVIAAVFTGVITLGFDMLWRNFSGIATTTAGTDSGGGGWSLPRGRSRGGSSRSSSNSKNDGAAFIVIIGIIIVVIAGTLSVMLRLALSRNREILADAGAVQITSDPDAMISALRKIEGHAAMPGLPSQVQAMLLENAAGTRGASFWATHPPIEERVATLVRVAGGRDPGPYTAPAAPPEDDDADKTRVAPPRPGPWGAAGATIPGAILTGEPLPPGGVPGLPPVLGGKPASPPPSSFADEIAALRARKNQPE